VPVLFIPPYIRYNGGIVKLASFEAIVRALNDAGVRHLVAGGLAVNAHGYLRFTKDADFGIQLMPDNVKRACLQKPWPACAGTADRRRQGFGTVRRTENG
jgi:hypothetical protein